jgi:hypothetical protein
MAFVLMESWDTSARYRGERSALPAGTSVSERLPLPVRRGGAVALSGAVHLMLVWLLTHHLAGTGGKSADATAAKEPLLVFDIESGGRAEPLREMPPLPSPSAKPIETVLDLTTPSEAPKPEWGLTRIAAPLAVAAVAASSSTDASGAIGGGGMGEEGFDPFAGASSLRQEQAEAAFRSELDSALLKAIQASVAHSFPNSLGSVELTVRASADGIVLDAQIAGGTASEETKVALRNAVAGKPLFRTGSKSGERRITLLRVRF